MHNYLLEGLDNLAIELEVNKIIKSNKFEEASKNIYDMEITTLDKALEDLDTYNFLSTKKIVEIRKIEELNQDENKEFLNHLYKYLDNPNDDNLLIIETNKLNNTLKMTKELKKKCQYVFCEENVKIFIKSSLKGYNIDNETLDLLDEFCLGDISKAYNECQKLKDYAYKEKTITKEMVLDLVVQKLGDSKDLTFAFTRSLAEKDKKKALEKYNKLLAYNIEPVAILGLLASQIRIMYQVKVLEKKHLTNKEIATILKEKSDYRISKTKELTKYYSEDEILELMIKLGQIDVQMKSQDVDSNFLIQLFIMNMGE